ncbi:MAG: histidine--tRNA ligase, partial [Chloroflexi bacterium]|nr:histidine--tRNA ligase [Chloroflexota bacterium]
TGFAIGAVVIGIILQEKALVPEFDTSPADVLVTVFDESLCKKSLELSTQLRNAGIATMVYPEAVKLQKQFKFADRMKMKVTLVLGPEEAEKGLVVVKNLLNGEQVQVQREAVVEEVKKLLR